MANDSYAAGETLTSKNYISDISVLSVSDDLLEVSGGKKILPNRIGSSLLSYTTTDSKSGALKNIILSDSGSAPKTKDGADYKKLCSISGMNLYGTYDSAAGDGITGLSLLAHIPIPAQDHAAQMPPPPGVIEGIVVVIPSHNPPRPRLRKETTRR